MSIPETEIVERETRALVTADVDLTPTMVTNIAATRARLQELQDFVREVMVEGEDFGTIPGAKKKILLKPGAEKLCEVYAYAQQIEVVNRIEDWDRPFFHYEIKCDLVSKRSGRTVGTGVGSCNSMEARYRWRDAQRLCPACGQAAIIKGKEEFGGGWLCFAKKGGCGAKYRDDDARIAGQQVGRLENDDIYTLVNTILKMAKKRAVVDATLSVTRSSALFTQDEEVIEAQARPAHAAQGRAPVQQPQRRSEAQAAQVEIPGHITVPQRKRLWTIAHQAKHSDDDVRAWLLGMGITSTSLVPVDRYDEICARLAETDGLPIDPEPGAGG